MNGLTKITLGGLLGDLFGREWNLCVSSPAEAIRAIDANTDGKLRTYLSTDGGKAFYRVALGRDSEENSLEGKELGNRSGETDIYILPTLKGANSGFGKILAGIAIIALAFYTGGATLAGGVIHAGTVGTIALGLGASLILGGVTQLLTPNPNFNDTQGQDASRGGNIFNGNAATISQGGAVGLVYGRALVTPMPVCISFNNEDLTLVNGQLVSTKISNTEYCRVLIQGGGYQWLPKNADGTCPPDSTEES